MKICEAINKFDSIKHNTYQKGEKVAWLSTLDGMAKRLIIDTHEGGESVVFNGYDESTPMDTQLLIPFPFDEVYQYWLEAKVYEANEEYDKYNSALAVFDTAWQRYGNWHHRTHMPIDANQGWRY